ncbi:MAG: CvpA family protein [Chitinophagaceae bacterium]|nr:CvpA family protein [Chitinophagaceae bacterium]
MWIDIVFAVILVAAVVKGLRQGLIVSLFSFAGLFIGLAAALKLSSVLAVYLRQKSQWESHWWPFISFIIIFLVVMLVVRWVAGMIEKTVEFAFMGWINKLGGFLLYACLYTIIFSIVLFYATRMNLVKEETKRQSKVYSYIEPWGPAAISGLGKVIPGLTNVFEDLQQFFKEAGDKIKPQ